MKKILAIALAILMVVSLVACGKDNNTTNNNNNNNNNNNTANDPAIEKFVNENREQLISTMESSFTQGSQGLTCKSSVTVKGKGFIMSININELTNVDDATKTQLQQGFDGMSDYFNQLLEQMKPELPTLEYYQVDVCDKDGNVLATVRAGK